MGSRQCSILLFLFAKIKLTAIQASFQEIIKTLLLCPNGPERIQMGSVHYFYIAAYSARAQNEMHLTDVFLLPTVDC